MIWRLLLRSWGRIRDLGLLALLADHLLTGLGSWVALAAGITIAGSVTLLMATAAATHAKAVSTENRVNKLVGDVSTANGRVNNLSGQNTSTNGLADGTIGGHTDTAGLANGTIGGSTGQINTGGGTAHTHGPGSLAVNNGTHQHGANATNGNLAVNSGQHNHTLPAA